MLQAGRDVVNDHQGQTLMGDKLVLLRPVRKGEARPAGQHLLRPLRPVIESVNWTFRGQLDLERHGGRTPEGIIARVLTRILALTAAVWHDDKTAQPVRRSLTAFDH